MKFNKNKKGVIFIYRNKRKPIREVIEKFEPENSYAHCFQCFLYNECSYYCSKSTKSLCNILEDIGIIKEEPEFLERFFVNAKTCTKREQPANSKK